MLPHIYRFKYFLFFLPFLICHLKVNAQDIYWIFLKDKKDVAFDPYSYFDKKTIEKRERQNIPLAQFTDLPLQESYTKSIAEKATEVLGESRWLNAAIISATNEQILEIIKLPYVVKAEIIASGMTPASVDELQNSISPADSALLLFQTARMKGDIFRERGIKGKGVRIAIFDTGFPGVDTNPAFEHLRQNNQIIKTYDFLKKQDFVYDYFNHGTMVLSCIAGKYKDYYMGLAPEAEFLLARTERAFSEIKNEEYTWVLAAEWADKIGADIISSSLGYSFHRYFQNELDGKTSYVSKAANIAASKGILVVNSAGNEATNRWQYIVTPADADSVLAVGGTDPYTDVAISFSSIGPTAEYKLKPNVSALGLVIAANKNFYTTTQGTSFSAPLVAGFAACVWQSNPDLSVMELFHFIEETGHLFPYYDFAHGYGIPQADKALGVATEADSTFKFQATEDAITIEIIHPLSLEMFKEEEEEIPVRNLYYKFNDSAGRIIKYGVIVVTEAEPVLWVINSLSNVNSIIVHYEGYTDEYLINQP